MRNPNLPGDNFGISPEDSEGGDETSNDTREKKKNKKKYTGLEVAAPVPIQSGAEDIVGNQHTSAEAAQPLWRRLTRGHAEEAIAAHGEIILKKETDRDKPADSLEIASSEVNEEMEGLDESEQRDATAAYVETRAADLENKKNTVPPGSDELPVIRANEDFIRRVEEAIQAQGQSEQDAATVPLAVTEVIETAYRETVQTYAPSEIITASTSVEADKVAQSVSGEASFVQQAANIQHIREDIYPSHDETATLVTSTPSAAGAMGNGGVPPRHHMGAYNAAGLSPQWNTAAAPYSGVLGEMTRPSEQTTETADWLAPAFLGALVGNFIGRRQGQRKAEQRFVPEKKKLETEVTKLLTTISLKEAQIRQFVRARLQPETSPRSSLPARETSSPRMPEMSATLAPAKNAERLPMQMPLESPSIQRSEGRPSTVRQASERIAATPMPGAGEASPRRTVELKKAETAVRQAVSVETMNRKELLEAGAAITIGSESLRSIYEDHKISEHGLRHLVAEYRRGGDLGHALKDEMLKHELSFEHDPLDDRDTPEQHPHTKEAAPAGLPTLPILPVWARPDDPSLRSSSLQTPEPLPSSSLSPPPKTQSHGQPTMRPVLVAANVAAFIILAVLVAVLLIIRF